MFASGSTWVSSDFVVPGRAQTLFGSPYVVQIPGGTLARCNPINAPTWCTSAMVESLPAVRPTGVGVGEPSRVPRTVPRRQEVVDPARSLSMTVNRSAAPQREYPDGDELLYLVSGRMTVVFDDGDREHVGEETTLTLGPGDACIVRAARGTASRWWSPATW